MRDRCVLEGRREEGYCLWPGLSGVIGDEGFGGSTGDVLALFIYDTFHMVVGFFKRIIFEIRTLSNYEDTCCARNGSLLVCYSNSDYSKFIIYICN